jgi:methylthioribulose-1-phosphate dehydratase
MSTKFTPAEAADILIETARGFYAKRWMEGTSGNLSIRIRSDEMDAPLRYLITASGHDKGALTANDFVLVGEGGQVLEPAGAKSSAETLLHEAIYQLHEEATAVYHVHTLAATYLSMHAVEPEGVLTFSDLEMIKGLGFDTHEVAIRLPAIENNQDMILLSQEVLRRLEPFVPGFILKGHGVYTWGRTPAEAKRHVEIWEFLFQYRMMAWVTAVNPQANLLLNRM